MLNWKLSKLQVSNFRNLSSELYEFSPGINCIFGNNGNGKTNVLEAIHVLISKKSFRKNASFPQYLGIDGDKPEVYLTSLFVDDEKESQAFSGKILEKQSQWFLNNQPFKSKLKLGIVFINPFDSHSFHNQASERRSWFDHYISQLEPSYKKVLKSYQSSLRFRNSLLSKKPEEYLSQVEAIDRELAKYSVQLTQARKNFLVQISEYLSDSFKDLFSESHELKISLETRFNQFSVDQVFEYYRSRIEKDSAALYTTYGVHKDDYIFLFDGLNSLDYCSLGQQKMSYLSLLFSFISLYQDKTQTHPLVLIDDVSGELDQTRWANLVEYLNKAQFQVFITTANEKFKNDLEQCENIKKIYMDSGNPQIF